MCVHKLQLTVFSFAMCRFYLHKIVLTEKTLLNVLNLIANAKTICAERTFEKSICNLQKPGIFAKVMLAVRCLFRIVVSFQQREHCHVVMLSIPKHPLS